MTREEAIKVLEAEKKFLFHGSLSDKHYEPAFDMAIEALEENESLAKSLNDAAELIRKLQKKNEWIPCSERLPEVDKGVFVYIYDMPFIAWVDKNGEWNTETFTLDKELEKDDEPIAWMPLPSPYKGDKS